MWVPTGLFLLVSVLNVCSSEANTNDSEYLIRKLLVRTQIRSRLAVTVVSCQLRNSGNEPAEAKLLIEMPQTGLITGLSIEKDGNKSVGIVKIANETEVESEEKLITSKPISLRKLDNNKFEFLVTVAANSSFTFNTSYQEVLLRSQGAYRHEIKLKSNQVAEIFTIITVIDEQSEIDFVKSPKLNVSSCNLSNRQLMKLTDDKEIDIRKVHFASVWTGSELFQKLSKEKQLETIQKNSTYNMVVLYDTKHQNGVQQIAVSDDYFLHSFVPEIMPKLTQNVLFLVDKILLDKEIFEDCLHSIVSKELSTNDTHEIFVVSNETISLHREVLLHTDSGNKSSINESVKNATVESALNQLNNNSITSVFIIINDVDSVKFNFTQFITANLTTLSPAKLNAFVVVINDANDRQKFKSFEQLSYRYKGVSKVLHGDIVDKVESLKEFASEVLGTTVYNAGVTYSNETVANDVVVISRRRNLCNETEFLAIGQIRQDPKLCENNNDKTFTTPVKLTATLFGQTFEGVQKNFTKEETLLCREKCGNSTSDKPSKKCSLTKSILKVPQPQSDYIEKMAKHMTVIQLRLKLRLSNGDQHSLKEISDKIAKMSVKCNFLTEQTVMEMKDLKIQKSDPVKKVEKVADENSAVLSHQLSHVQLTSEVHSVPEVEALKDDKSGLKDNSKKPTETRQKDDSPTPDATKQPNCYKTLPARYFNVEKNYLNKTGPFASRAECAASCYQNGFCRVALWDLKSQECHLSYQYQLPTCQTEEQSVPNSESLIMYCISCNPAKGNTVGNNINS